MNPDLMSCPVCGGTDTLEALENLASNLRNKLWGRKYPRTHTTVRRITSRDTEVVKQHRTCAGCGTLYQPDFRRIKEKLHEDIRHSKEALASPLEKLAQAGDDETT